MPVCEVGDYRYHEYASDVRSGKQVACRWIRLAVDRWYADLAKQGGPDYPYCFNDEDASRACDFFPIFLRHYQGELAGTPLYLEPWEQFIVANIYGWKRKADDLRRFRKVYVSVARKNGKSLLAVGIGIKGLLLDGEGGPRVVCAATKRAQARIVWDIAALTIEQNEEMVRAFGINIQKSVNATKISVIGTAADFIPLGQDSKTEDGHNIHVGIVDEYHEHPDDNMVGVIRTAMGARSQPLLFVITTAGFDVQSPAYEEEQYLKRILEGVVEDDAYFGLIYTLDEGDEWWNPDVWIKSNPNLHVGKKPEQISNLIKEAQHRPSILQQLKVKELNIWTQTAEIWIRHDDWAEVERAYEVPDGQPFWGGVDLSKTIDTTAYAKCWAIDGLYCLDVHVFLPEYDIDDREKRERVPWREWAIAGHVTLTPGRTVDYDYIEAQVIADADQYDLRELAYDPFNSSQFISNLENEGLEDRLVEFSQGWKHISPAAKDFETKVLNKQLRVRPNPCIAWMVACTEIKSDANGNIRPIKPDPRKTNKHIDGVLAMIMALDRAVRHQEDESVYEHRGVRTV